MHCHLGTNTVISQCTSSPRNKHRHKSVHADTSKKHTAISQYTLSPRNKHRHKSVFVHLCHLRTTSLPRTNKDRQKSIQAESSSYVSISLVVFSLRELTCVHCEQARFCVDFVFKIFIRYIKTFIFSFITILTSALHPQSDVISTPESNVSSTPQSDVSSTPSV